jgi:transposase
MIPFGLVVEGARMRGSDQTSGSLFSYVDLESRVPAKHPLRVIKALADDVLVSLDAEFERLYEGTGRQSIAPERLLRASLLQAFYSVRSERQLMEQIDYNLLFRWFVGLGIDDPVWDHSTFSKNRDRLLDADVAAKFLEAVLRHPKVKQFLSDDHFSVDGTLVEAWASLKSFRAKDGSDEPPAPGRNGERDFRDGRLQSDPDAEAARGSVTGRAQTTRPADINRSEARSAKPIAQDTILPFRQIQQPARVEIRFKFGCESMISTPRAARSSKCQTFRTLQYVTVTVTVSE